MQAGLSTPTERRIFAAAAQLRSLSAPELAQLAADIRTAILDATSASGGHVSPNLGVVELSIALWRTFDPFSDRLFWDVSHQIYTHKLLSGRSLQGLRTFGHISGYSEPSESAADVLCAGHSSTSISLAVGTAKAFALQGTPHKAIAIIGDGAMGSGLAYEALNELGSAKLPAIVVLNDNKMSISAPIGALSRFLSQSIASPAYQSFRKGVLKALDHLPDSARFAAKRIEDSLKLASPAGMFFEELGLSYIGPIDGHDIAACERALALAKSLNHPALVHVITQKGRGYAPAEGDSTGAWHGVGPFKIDASAAGNAQQNPAEMKDAFVNNKDVNADSRISINPANLKDAFVSADLSTGGGATGFRGLQKDNEQNPADLKDAFVNNKDVNVDSRISINPADLKDAFLDNENQKADSRINVLEQDLQSSLESQPNPAKMKDAFVDNNADSRISTCENRTAKSPDSPAASPAVRASSATAAFSAALADLMADNERICAITAAMPSGTGLDKIISLYPARCWDVGIAEAHACTQAAALAVAGLRPVVAVYSTFAQRAIDSIIHDIALNNAPVVLALDRAGVVGQDGKTHQGVFDLALLRCVPNMSLFAPVGERSMAAILAHCLQLQNPSALRYARGAFALADEFDMPQTQPYFIRKRGAKICALGWGEGVADALAVGDAHGFDVANLVCAKPIAAEFLAQLREYELVLVYSHTAKAGGLGELLAGCGVRALSYEFEDAFITHGHADVVLRSLGRDQASLIAAAAEFAQ